MSRKGDRAGGDGGRGGRARVSGQRSTARGGNGGEGVIGSGGPGGDADVVGNNSTAVGGPGGRGGLGEGGPGMNVVVRGDNTTSAGGEGGESNQPDGRGGRGGRSGYFTLNRPADHLLDDWMSYYGRGGDAGHSPQYAARLMVIQEILGRKTTMYAESAGIREHDTGSGILDRVNAQLVRDGHAWRVRVTAGCFEFYDL